MANKTFVIQYLIKARDQFSAAAEKTKQASEKMRASIEKANTSFKAASAQIGRSIQDIKKRFEESGFHEIGEKIRNTGAKLTAFLTVPIALGLRSIINTASDAQETADKFRMIFSEVENSGDAVLRLTEKYKLAKSSGMEMLATTGAMISASGMNKKRVLELSESLSGLAIDLQSMHNYKGTATEASLILSKALLGEAETLKTNFGIAILQDEAFQRLVKTKAKSERITMQAAKAEVIYAKILQQATAQKSIDNFNLTLKGYANQTRVLSERTKKLSESFGELLLPIATKIVQKITLLVDKMNELSPQTKKMVLIIAALAATAGPLLLVIGGVVMLMPVLLAGFATFKVLLLSLLSPIGLVMAGFSAAAYLIIDNWESVKTFFKGFGKGFFSEKLFDQIEYLKNKFKDAAKVITDLFSSDGEASKNFLNFANIGQMVGDIVRGALDIIIRGLAGIGEILGQLAGAIFSLDFSKFDVGAIKAEFLGAQSKPSTVNSRIDVGVNVGLEKGLIQQSPITTIKNNVRRSDVGVLAQ